MSGYSRIALPHSEYGEHAYSLGVSAGSGELGLEHVMFDADEVLWDWVMTTRDIVRGIPKLLRSRDLGHFEYIRVKPGIIEFLCGFRDARAAQGADAYLRIWTNAYPWRVRAICERLPDLAGLLGGDTSQGIWEHPRIFTRPHYAHLVTRLFEEDRVDEFIESIATEPRPLIERHLHETPSDTTLKLPDLALHVGKNGFEEVRILIDDRRRNVDRFAASASNRVGLWVDNPPHPSVLKRLPNVTRGHASRYLEHQSRSYIRSLHRQLTALPDGGVHALPAVEEPRGSLATEFAIAIPDDVLRAQWTAPPKRLKRESSRRR